jgi:cytochrome c-type biogenesis protein CcmF
MLEGRDVRIGARLQIQDGRKKPVEVVPAKVIRQGEQSDQTARYLDKIEFSIVGMRPDREAKENSSVEIGWSDLQAGKSDPQKPKADILVVEASVKPYINLVWNGVIILIVGFIITIVRRAQEARLKAGASDVVQE